MTQGDQHCRLLPAGSPHHRRRGLSVLLRDHHQLQNRAPRSSRSTSGRRSVSLDELCRRLHQRLLPAQSAQLAGHLGDGRLSVAAPRPHRRLSRWRASVPRPLACILFTILSVSMFPQLAVLAGLFELVRTVGLINTPFALIFSYMIFTLPFTVWVLTTFIRDLPIEIEEAAIVDGATPWVIITQRLHAADVAGAGDHRAARLHRRLERVPVRADLHVEQRAAHRAGRDRAPLRQRPSSRCPGATSWRRR